MDEDQRKILIDEVHEIIRSRYKFIDKYYLLIRDAYKNYYGWSELDPLRNEICICIMFGLCQAAITLTNHLLESLLKNALIISRGKDKNLTKEQIKGRSITSLSSKYEEGIKLYGGANLEKTINRACTLGLITKEQKRQLHEFRERFRNAYGHSDKLKTFGKSTIPVTGLRLEDDKIELDETGEPEIANFLIAQGIAQVILAKNDAPPYFLYIDKLTREIIDKLFGSNKNT